MPPSPPEARQRQDRASSTGRLRRIAPIPSTTTLGFSCLGSFPSHASSPSHPPRTLHQEGSVPSDLASRPQLPETPRRAHPLPTQPNVNVSPLNVRWTPIPNSSQLELQPPAVREEILGSYLVNNIITCETPAEVDVESLLSPHKRDVRDETIKGFERNFDKLKVASKQLGNELTDDERRKKGRADDERRRIARIADLDRVWPDWIPQRIRRASGSDLTLKIVRSIHHVATEIRKVQADFHLDSLWSSTGIFRRHLKDRRLTVKVAKAAEQEVIDLLRRGGIPALLAAQAVNPTPSEGNDDITAATPEPKVNNIVEETSEPTEAVEAFALAHPEPLPDFKPQQSTDPDLYSATPPVPATPARSPTHIVDPDTGFNKNTEFFPVDFDFDLPAVSSLVHETNDHLEPPPVSPSLPPPKPSVAPPPFTSSMMEASGRSSKSHASQSGDPMNYQLLASMAGVKRTHSGSDPGGKKQKTEGKFRFLSKLQTQLATDTRLTDDVLNIICKAVYAAYRNDGNKGMLLDPLWFHKDKPSEALPIGPKGIKERPRMYFPIHHPDAEHWALGTLESVSDGFRFCYYDSQSSSGRFEGVCDRLRKWLDKSGFGKEELEVKQKACPQQNDTWSCGIYAAFFLSMVLRRRAFPTQIDLVAEKSNILNILGSVDLAGSFSEEEKRALRGLRKRGEGQNSRSLEDRLSRCTIDTLHQRLKTAEQRLTEATENRKQASDRVSSIKAKQESRTDLLQQMQTLMGKLGGKLNQHALQARESVSRRSSGIHQPLTASVGQGSSSSDLLSMLDETSEQSQTQSIKMNHAGVRVGAEWMASGMQNPWPSLDHDLAVAEEQHASAYTAVVDALEEVKRCSKAIEAKGDFDELVRARAAFDECAMRCEVWETEDMDGGISLPDLE